MKNKTKIISVQPFMSKMGGSSSRPFFFTIVFPASYLLFAGTIRFTSVNQRRLEIRHLAGIGDKDAQSRGDFAVPRWVTNHFVRQTAHDFVAGPVFCRVL